MQKKTLKNFESPVTHRGVEYKMDAGSSVFTNMESAARLKEAEGYKALIVTIELSRNLKGRTDLHGKPYQPSQFLFLSEKKS